MIVVIDANELFSLLIKGAGGTEYVFFSNKVELIAPEYLLLEFGKYREEILDKTHRPAIELSMILSAFERRIKFVPGQEFENLLNEAAASLPEDPKDAPYIALAMKYNAVIWSEDKQLKRQSKVKVLNTSELLGEIKNSI
ncbi:MAG: hypothetical protein JW724_06990 [Candidatus Altiarchaeota archaeon]|nr:hypothetical protein [Candidatus Altiarchaeota archaeon]